MSVWEAPDIVTTTVSITTSHALQPTEFYAHDNINQVTMYIQHVCGALKHACIYTLDWA